jgi:hypothetical protein
MLVIPATEGSTNRKTIVQAGPVIKQDPISKITNAKRAGEVAQEAEHLPALATMKSRLPSPTKQNPKGALKVLYTISLRLCT